MPHRPLVPDLSKSVGDCPDDDNLIIRGDNLHALKALLPRYADRVKCIYIDPPYNTGNEGWVYNDNVNGPLQRVWLEENGLVDNEDLLRHDKWLCMMWPRLHLLKELLAYDGVIFVSIDDNEFHHLRMLMDTIFGERNFIANFVWEGTGKNDARFVSVGHDYVMCFAKDRERLRLNGARWRALKQGVDEINKVAGSAWQRHDGDSAAASDELQEWFGSLDKRHKSHAHRHYRWVDERGVYFAGDISWPGGGGPDYEILHPVTDKPVKVPATGWRFPDKAKMLDAVKEGRVHFGSDESSVPNLKRYLADTDSQVLASVFYQDRRAAHKDLVRILPEESFEYPKDERVIRRLLEVVTSGADVVLDSFAGSGTTGQAVLALNRQDGGNRKFILVEGEDYADAITAERVRRVIAGVPEATDVDVRDGLGGSFTYCTLGEPVTSWAMLTGETLPSYSALAAWLMHTATGRSTPSSAPLPLDDNGLIHRDEARRRNYFLHYEPDMDWLESRESMLDIKRALAISNYSVKQGAEAVIFAAGKFMSQDDLVDLNISFCQLPWAIRREDQV
ncbi:MAG: site-specific DNA-methyltransferase [Acidimicrobiaceae bacterium]|nr:site-specific DNA-methyltransferase [Acidimicrobiaceae bacterium]